MSLTLAHRRTVNVAVSGRDRARVVVNDNRNNPSLPRAGD